MPVEGSSERPRARRERLDDLLSDRSRASQRRDLSDPEVITELAEVCQTVERLDLLALVTWVDIAGVAPGMFNDWKARLLGLAVQRVRAYLLDPETGGAIRGRQESEARAVLARFDGRSRHYEVREEIRSGS